MKKIIIMVIAGVVLFGAGFGSGIYYQKGKNGTSQNINANDFPSNGFGSSNGTPPSGFNPGANGGRSGMGGGVSGEIISKSDSSITVKKSDGSTVIVYITDDTTVSKNESIALSDLSVGTSIQVMGTTNSDNTVSSTSIMVRNDDESSS